MAMNDDKALTKAGDTAPADPSRRQSLKQIGGLAASVAPAMVVLLQGDKASAHYTGQFHRHGRPWQCDPTWNYGNGNAQKVSGC